MRTADLARVHALLDGDRAWAAYAIGDLAPGFSEHSEWHIAGGDSNALVLVYRGFSPPIVFAMGGASDVAPLFEEIAAPVISLHVRPDTLAAIRPIYVPTSTSAMRRMVLSAPAFAPVTRGDVCRLTESDAAKLAALYDDGHRRGEGPAFFEPAMLRQRSFHGVYEGGDLVAVAGTHVYSAELGVCAVGNVYTRSDRRGRGLAARVTTAVVAQALTDRISTIVLNVSHDNDVARRLYERLGFRWYCDFYEGTATR
jgi:GNAT superfamily N-acetyltransferase